MSSSCVDKSVKERYVASICSILVQSVMIAQYYIRSKYVGA